VIRDGDTESLIRKYLKAGVMNQGKYEPTDVGTPQGGNLSPLLSNIMLNELDYELDRRHLNFVRYADDVVIVLKSKAAATRVMYSVTSWIERKLGLKVNATKTKVTPPSKLKYLGFGFWNDKGEWKARPHEDSVERLKRKLKSLCKRNWSIDLTYRIKKINEVSRGWINYFRIGSMKAKLQRIDEQMRVRVIIIIWKQWKTRAKRVWGLRKLGINLLHAKLTAGIGDRYMVVAHNPIAKKAISKEKLTKRGLISLSDYYLQVAHV
jgi:group II intron reverse transcriptase/maturase